MNNKSDKKMTQYYEERIYSLEYPEGMEREELECLETEESQLELKSQEKTSRSSRILERLTEKAKFNNRYFETSHTLEKNKRQAILKANGYFKL